MKAGFVYILASGKNGTIYTGVTSDLIRRVYQHRQRLVQGFTKKHGCKLLVWFEAHDDLQEARRRELQIKEWKRAWKVRLIEESNLEWDDLYLSLSQAADARPGPRPSPGNREVIVEFERPGPAGYQNDTAEISLTAANSSKAPKAKSSGRRIVKYF